MLLLLLLLLSENVDDRLEKKPLMPRWFGLFLVGVPPSGVLGFLWDELLVLGFEGCSCWSCGM